MLIHVSVVRDKETVSQISAIQWNLSIKETPSKGHLSKEGTVCCPNHIELCPTTSELGTPLHTGHLAESQWCPL